MPALRTLTTWVSPRVADQRGQQRDGRLGVVRAAAAAPAGRAWRPGPGRRTCRAAPARSRPPPAPASAAPLLRAPPRRAPRSSAGSTTGPRPPRSGRWPAGRCARRSRAPCAGDQVGQPVGAVHHDGPLPGQVVQADVVQGRPGPARRRAAAANSRWKPMATLHRPTARCPASSRARVTMPTGLVKSMIQAPGVGPAPGPLGDVQDDRHGAQRLGQPPGAGRLLADAAALQGPRLVAGGGPPGRRPAAGAARRPRRRGRRPGWWSSGPGPGGPAPAHDPRGDRADRPPGGSRRGRPGRAR